MEHTHSNEWSPNIQAMYDQGSGVLQVFGKNTLENRAKLTAACQNAIDIEETELLLKGLETAGNVEFAGKRWQEVQKYLNRLNKRLRDFQRDTLEFGWTPLARVLLVQKYRRLKCSSPVPDLESNPMELLLRKHCTLGMDPPAPIDEDPMELLLRDK